MRRVFLILISAVLLAGLFLLGRSAALDGMTAGAIAAAEKVAAAEGLLLHEVTVGESGFEGLFSPVWRNLSAALETVSRPNPLGGGKVALSCVKATLSPVALDGGTFRLTLRGLEARREQRPGDRAEDTLTFTAAAGEFISVDLRTDFLRPWRVKGRMAEALAGLRDLLRDGKTALPLEMQGKAFFSFRGEALEFRFEVRRRDGRWHLMADRNDLTAMSMKFDLRHPLTEAEVDLLSRYPVRAPRLFSLRNRARAKAKEAHRKNRRVSEDAFRHVIWSYLLTKRYGADFARMVTDAHEEGRTGNSAAEKAMDLQNNTVGRSYARIGYEEDALPTLVAADREVVANAAGAERVR